MKINKTLYIHIGTGKTGTSAIQKTCEVNSELILKKYDVSFIKKGHEVCKNWFRHPKSEDLSGHHLGKLKNYIATCSSKKYIISSEFFPGLQLEEIRELKEIFDKICNIKIIVYFRRQDDFIWSWYAQVVKTSDVKKTLDGMMDQLYAAGNILDYNKCITDWETTFGQENIRVNIYPPREPILKNFFRSLDIGLNLYDIERLPGQNLSLTPEQICLIGCLQSYIDTWDRKLIKQLQTPVVFPFNFTKSLLSPSQRKKILNDFEESNRLLANKYFNRIDLFDELKIDDEDTWSMPDIFNNGYYEKFMKVIEKDRPELYLTLKQIGLDDK